MDTTDKKCGSSGTYLHGGNESVVVHGTTLIKENRARVTVARFGSAQFDLPVASGARQLIATLSQAGKRMLRERQTG